MWAGGYAANTVPFTDHRGDHVALHVDQYGQYILGKDSQVQACTFEGSGPRLLPRCFALGLGAGEVSRMRRSKASATSKANVPSANQRPRQDGVHFYSGDLGNRIVDNILWVVEQHHQAKPLIGRNPQSGGGDEEDEDGGMHAVTSSQCAAAAHNDFMCGSKREASMGRRLRSEDESPEIRIQEADRSPCLTLNTIDADKAKEFHVDEHHAEEWVDTEVDSWVTTEANLFRDKKAHQVSARASSGNSKVKVSPQRGVFPREEMVKNSSIRASTSVTFTDASTLAGAGRRGPRCSIS